MVTELSAKLLPMLQQSFFIFLGLLGMGFLIGFHELGHFLFAKLFKIRVPSFSLGFGPRLISKKIGETDFCLSLIPFGGYVEIAGAAEVGQGEQKDAHARDEGSFAVKPFYQKMGVMFGGILFNFIFAYFIMILLFITGVPKTPFIPNAIISSVQAGSTAEKYEFKAGDRIVSINDYNVENNIHKISSLVEPLALKEATIIIDREGEKITKNVIIGTKEVESSTIGALGAEFDFLPTPPHSIKDAIINGVATCNMWIKNTFLDLAKLFSPSRKNLDKIGGPIMIIAMTVKSAASGFQIFLLFLALISINLAVLNLIPLPILDGGQILFYSIEALIGRPLPAKVREYIFIATWIMFIVLFIYLSFKDINRIAGSYMDPILKLLHIK